MSETPPLQTPTVTIARKVHFSSGHRYFNPQLSDDQNKKLFGKHYSTHGHGHNFTLEGFFKGPVDPESGIVVNLSEIDELLKKVSDPFDHHFINTDVPYFKKIIPTTENIASYFFGVLKKEMSHPGVELVKIRLYEGDSFWVDVE
ncbi:MAG: 6-carboxytetrahydropterin synthase [Pseudomonadota bacterium]|nr:6-carboxytetrahydropterin synthase [Pseudomonadota bacterium]